MINTNIDIEGTILYNYYYDLNDHIKEINNKIKNLISQRDYCIKQKLLIKILIMRYFHEIRNRKMIIKKRLVHWLNTAKNITHEILGRKVTKWIIDKYRISNATTNWKILTNLLFKRESFLEIKEIISSTLILNARNNWEKLTNLLIKKFKKESFLKLKGIILRIRILKIKKSKKYLTNLFIRYEIISKNKIIRFLKLLMLYKKRVNILEKCIEFCEEKNPYSLINAFLHWNFISNELYKREIKLFNATLCINKREIINIANIIDNINYEKILLNMISIIKKYDKNSLREAYKKLYINALRVKFEAESENNYLQILISREEIKELKKALSKNAIELSLKEKLMVVIFQSINQDISYPMICKNTTIFSEIVNSLYNIYPKYRDIGCFFI